MIFFIIFSRDSLATVRSLPQPSQTILTSVPPLATVKISVPQGCFFLRHSLSFTSKRIILAISRLFGSEYLKIGIKSKATVTFDFDLISAFYRLVELEGDSVIGGISRIYGVEFSTVKGANFIVTPK